MRNTLFGLLAAVGLLSGVARAAEPSTATTAQDRASIYQREIRLALLGHGWHITRNDTGKLTAERRWYSREGTGAFIVGDELNRFARLQIDFRADGKDHTAASARASLCYYRIGDPDNVGQTVYPPLALRDPRLTEEYRAILAEADSRLASGRRVDVAIRTSGSRNADRIALK